MTLPKPSVTSLLMPCMSYKGNSHVMLRDLNAERVLYALMLRGDLNAERVPLHALNA